VGNSIMFNTKIPIAKGAEYYGSHDLTPFEEAVK
jgi:hypothetical protein